ncbi:DUF2231 domain-containing protein [Nakamurella lactea]|jgi:hypothetical protein|uniref:DUF2231 domain-containing protein n=1 Tax=Nakamurella lactea TaxID=459515 RepID=UPI0003F9C3FD|nr:DUF2231 domain-containing protein [Nakamurella lactea]
MTTLAITAASWHIGGLPLHPLLVHGVVVLLPLAGVAAILHAAWPAARRRLGIVTPGLATVALILVPITVRAGEALAAAIGTNPKIARHQQLGQTLLPWVIGLFVVAGALWVWYRYFEPRQQNPRTRLWVNSGLLVLAMVAGIGSIVDVVLIGDAGARAVWEGVG